MQSSSPTTEGIQPYAGVSEFELPARTRQIAIRIIGELFVPIGERLAQAGIKMDAARLSASKLDAFKSAHATSKLDAIKNAQEAKLKDLVSKADSLKSELQQFCDKAEMHLKEQGIKIPDNYSSAPVASFNEPMDGLQSCRKLLQKICSRKKTVLYFRNEDGSIAWLANLITYFILSGLAISFWFITIPAFAIFIWVRQSNIGETEKYYSTLLGTSQKIIAQLEAEINQAQKDADDGISQVRKETDNAISQARKEYDDTIKIAEMDFQLELRKIEEDFLKVAEILHYEVDQLWEKSIYAATNWDSSDWNNWSPDPSPEFAARIGILTTDSDKFHELFPKIDFCFRVPALIPFAEGRCLALNAVGKQKNEASNALLAVMVRVLANTPAGKARFTLIDPVGLGQNVADFLHLGDFNKDLISGKAWSEPQHIEQQLTLLTEHMETVIQTCLRKEFVSILDYNRERHEVAQPFRFLVINDFPVNFSESSARRLTSIIKNGPRCGVFTFLLCDTEKKLPYGFNFFDLGNAATWISWRNNDNYGEFVWQDKAFENFRLVLDAMPEHALTNTIVKKWGELAIPAMKIDVPFEKLLTTASLDKSSWWKFSTAEGLKVPIGPAGARAIQELALGGDQEAHALLVGRTGSGKTNLMHVIITALALKYPADEVQLYLVDFKGGVGFKRYAEYKLPQAKVIAIESEREFGLSVLRGLDAELKLRSEVFRAASVDNLFAYRLKMKAEKSNNPLMPRILLIVDEFQEFFSENDDLAQQAKMIFERLARQGRSFGIHFLLATQSLSGSAQLPSSIMGQIKVRIALPCSEADSRLILADDNKAARALSLPGEGIYNPLGGLVEGNNRFQVARFADEDLPKYLSAVAESARDKQPPLIFEGNELAHIEECAPLKELLAASTWPKANKNIEIFLGEPIAIMPPVAARFRRQSGGNLMVLCREEIEGVGMCMSAFLDILAQQAPETRRVYLADFTTADTEWAQHAEEIVRCFPGEATIVRRQRDVSGMLATIAKEVQARDEKSGQGNIYLILQGMHRIKSLREDIEDDDGNNAVELLKTILKDGPEVGVHVIAWADTYENVTRGMDRRSMGEFGLRVAGVMDSGDSMNFLDHLAASKISKPHRAIFYDEDRPGQFLTFRPYKLPSVAWLQQTKARLMARVEKQKDFKV